MPDLDLDGVKRKDWDIEPLKKRIFKNIAIPITAATVIFTVCIAIAVVIVMFKPKMVTAEQLIEEHIIENETIEEPLAEESFVEDKLFVHVTGKVLNPGVYELKQGARAHDAILAAGGHLEEAALEMVNLARVLTDGEQLHIPDVNEPLTASETDAVAAAGLININTADTTALQTLNGIGPALAERIIDWRESNGGFKNTEELMQVSGIGVKVFESLKDQITL